MSDVEVREALELGLAIAIGALAVAGRDLSPDACLWAEARLRQRHHGRTQTEAIDYAVRAAKEVSR